MMLTLILTLFLPFVLGTEFTFELLNSEKQCFYEELEAGVKFEIDYQVIAGGNYDVDCYVTDPENKLLYLNERGQSDSISSSTANEGTYQVCFSSEFSIFTYRKVYLRFRFGEEPPLVPEMHNGIGIALTQMDISCLSIHKLLEDSSKSLAWSKLREARDRTKAERVLDRVTYWFIGETTLLVVIIIVQVMTLKSVSNENLSDDLDDSEVLLKPANPEISSSEKLERQKESITPAGLWRHFKRGKKQKGGVGRGIQARLAKPFRVSVIHLPDAHSPENKMDRIFELRSRRSLFDFLPSWRRLRNSRARSSQLKNSFIFQTDRKLDSQPLCASVNQET